VPLLVSILTFTIFYWIVPNTHVPVIVALAGGSFAGALWEIAKYGFSYYATHFANYSAVYGSLAGVILLLVWIYYSAIVVIMGAEVASVYAGRRVPSTG
jgi:membrane protein